MFTSAHLWLLAATALPALVRGTATCWYPDGITPAPGDVPCNSTAETSACCSSSALCMANGLCLAGAVLSRGSCTDKSWLDNACAPYCQDVNPPGGTPIMNCIAGLTEQENYFTCGLFPGNCSNSSLLFSMTNMDAYVLKADQLSSAEAAAGTSAPSTSSTSNPVATTTVTVSSATNRGYSSGAMAGVGVGIGIPLLIVIGVLSFLLMREKKRRRASTVPELNGSTLKHDIGYSPHGSDQQSYPQPYSPQHMQQQPLNWPPPDQSAPPVQPKAELPGHDEPRELPARK